MLREGTRKEDIDAARAQLEQQQRRLDTLMKQRAETNVIAPNDGIVQSMGLRPGDLVGPNQTVAELLEPDQLWVRVYVPETELGLVHAGMAVRVRVDTFPNRWFDAHIGTIASQGEYTPRNVQTRAQRVELVYAELLGVLEKAGLERIDAEGKSFDPTEHEAVLQEDGDGEPIVADILRTGYRLKGRVLRPAMVKVAR